MQNNGYKQESVIMVDDSGRFNGIFRDAKNKKFLIKAIHGSKKGYPYQSLYNEAQVTHYLSLLAGKTNISHNGYTLSIPTVEKIIDQDEFFCFVTKFVDGRRLINESITTQAKILLLTATLVSQLNKKIQKKSIQPYLKNYTRKAMLLSLPSRFIKAIILTPVALRGLTHAFLKSLPLISSITHEQSLVHPDINSSNIIINKKNIYLTDWEETGWGISAYNAITPLCVHWHNQPLRNTLLRKLFIKKQKNIHAPLLAYRILMLFNQRIEKKNIKRKRDYMLLKFLGS